MWDRLDDWKTRGEGHAIADAMSRLTLYDELAPDISRLAARLVEKARAISPADDNLVEAFLRKKELASVEGRALLRLCEALERTSDKADRAMLLREQLDPGDWKGLLGAGAGSAYRDEVMAGVRSRISALSGHFVMAESIEEAIRRADGSSWLGSFDMLGEGARSDAEAARYERAYAQGIDAIACNPARTVETNHGVSVKLSALGPRYEAAQAGHARENLYPRLKSLMLRAAAGNIGFYIDAEECDRLVLSLELLERLEADAPEGWRGLGLAVQAYQVRALKVVDALIDFARAKRRRLMIRLVKGAYWDSEIKAAQVQGWTAYPVFTAKPATDVSYLACAATMLKSGDAIFPSFATHNAHAVAAVQCLAARLGARFEYQRLHGMGDALYTVVEKELSVAPRVYAPVGRSADLLPYLVRRLLESGANSAFVRQLRDSKCVTADIVRDPAAILRVQSVAARVASPTRLYGAERENSTGLDLSVRANRDGIAAAVAALDISPIAAQPLVAGWVARRATEAAIVSPADTRRVVGIVSAADDAAVDRAFVNARDAQPRWARLGGAKRAAILRKAAAALQTELPRFVALIAREAGRTLRDAIGEVREAVDFLRYCAGLAEEPGYERDVELKGPTGERNLLRHLGRGVFVCISPWNASLAIFIRQIAAALAAGNAVVAKPARQTPLVAFEAVKLLLAAGVPECALSLLFGGAMLGRQLVKNESHDGIAFSGRAQTANAIAQLLHDRNRARVPFIAETGGLNSLFVDTTAHPEQVVDDVVVSAFGAAGQSCASLRFLFLPKARANDYFDRLKGAMQVLGVGDPALPYTDVGPLIDADAKAKVECHVETLNGAWRLDLSPRTDSGHFAAPTVCRVDTLDGVECEFSGPVLHIVEYAPGEAEKWAKALCGRSYALTLGVHSRLKSFRETIEAALPAGKIYVNRSIAGGGRLVARWDSGARAGGPNVLHAFSVEQAVSINEAASGGDLQLFNAAHP
jgi:RHH-type transcriptional regulator, proline utilization regulon repressor / proline dehydrogenase / delta 1-pyrroline-5-carboxylate dehydrogenase